MQRKIPQRTCLGCGTKRPKREMIRIIRTPNGDAEIDLGGKKSGRGAYVCPDEACLSNLVKSKCLERVLEMPLPPALMEELSILVKEKNGSMRR